MIYNARIMNEDCIQQKVLITGHLYKNLPHIFHNIKEAKKFVDGEVLYCLSENVCTVIEEELQKLSKKLDEPLQLGTWENQEERAKLNEEKQKEFEKRYKEALKWFSGLSKKGQDHVTVLVQASMPRAIE